MVDTRPYARKVRRSLLQRELMGGVPQTGLVGLFVMAVVFIYVFSMFFMIIPIVILYLVMRHLTKKDPWLIDIVLENIQQKDVFIP
ncbi:MAG: VirB3 family type IV secretion system protein [Treponema sp.]|jgi:type IV secretory pathway VirB3-like protein|nr:VirB3 family type IV secretion system protein [Treponema sp.]